MIKLIPSQVIDQLKFQTYQPRPQLAAWIQCLWSIHGEGKISSSSNKFYPDGGASLTIAFSSSKAQIFLLFNKHTFQQTINNSQDIISIRFKPAALQALLGIDASIFSEQFQQLELGQDYSPSWYVSLRQKVDAMPVFNLGECVTQLQEWLLDWQKYCSSIDNRSLALIKTIQQSHIPLDQLGSTLGMTRRTLERRLKRDTGFTPQEIIIIDRIQLARELLCRPEYRLVDVAMQCGYFDQAHFSHYFKKFTLETPSDYRNRKLSQIYKP